MSQQVLVEIEMPTDLEEFHLPTGMRDWLRNLLDRQDRSKVLTVAEQAEAEGPVNLAEMLSLYTLDGLHTSCHHNAREDKPSANCSLLVVAALTGGLDVV